MKKRWIITGAAGHLGTALQHCLAQGEDEVRAFVLAGEKPFCAPNIHVYTGDVTQPQTLQPLFDGAQECETYVLHAAGMVSIATGCRAQLERINVGGTQNIIDCCRRTGARMVYISSVHALPEKKNGADTTEINAFSPDAVVGDYAKTKAIATQRVLDATRDGLDAVVVHPSGILGPYDSGRNHVVQMLSMYLHGRLPVGVRGGYDFVDVRDVAQGCIAAALHGRCGECYLLTGRYISVREMLDLSREVLGGRRIPCLPAAPLKALAPLFERFAKLTKTRPLFTRYALYTLGTNSHFSHDKATRELGFTPRNIRDTIADTLAWLRRQPVSQ